jgi:hypothetical protein
MGKTRLVKVRITAEERAAWEGEAEKAKLSLSEWMRRTLNAAGGEPVAPGKVKEPVRAVPAVPRAVDNPAAGPAPWAKNYSAKTLADFEKLYGRSAHTEIELAGFAKRGW